MTAPLQLYSFPTPNGQKITIALEEMGLAYELRRIDITKGEQFAPEFVKINPNSKIPALVDPQGDHGRPLALMESGAILVYLARKSELFWSPDLARQSEILQWLFFQVGGVGPMFGQFGHFFKYAGAKCDHPYPLERYRSESRRLLGVLDKRLAAHPYLAGDEYTIADMATMPWVHGLSAFYKAQEILGLGEFNHVNAWVERLLARPQTRKGMGL